MTGTRDALAALSDEIRDRLRRVEMPEWTEPMLATLTRDVFSDPDWIFERKLDGVRCLAFKSGSTVRLLSRNRKRMNDTWPELEQALERQSGSFVVDGEIVAFDGDRTSFSRLQARIGIRDADEARSVGVPVVLYLFDILHLSGQDTTDLPLRARKGLLKRALDWKDPLRYTPHRNERGQRLLAEACRKGWEGLIGKHADQPYSHGRSRQWLKLKCGHRQEFVIVGYTDPQGSRTGFGALLLGYHEDEQLRYAGKVGTGFDDDQLRELGRRLSRHEVEEPPVSVERRPEGAHWVRPRLVAEVGFTEWTRAGRLRHPRYLGLRTDKKPEEVVRERPEVGS
jgi:bifunctional non-homologous end joining protein LigD